MGRQSQNKDLFDKLKDLLTFSWSLTLKVPNFLYIGRIYPSLAPEGLMASEYYIQLLNADKDVINKHFLRISTH